MELSIDPLNLPIAESKQSASDPSLKAVIIRSQVLAFIADHLFRLQPDKPAPVSGFLLGRKTDAKITIIANAPGLFS